MTTYRYQGYQKLETVATCAHCGSGLTKHGISVSTETGDLVMLGVDCAGKLGVITSPCEQKATWYRKRCPQPFQ